MAKLQPEFESRNVKVIGLSVDATDDHEAWANDIEETQGAPQLPDHRRRRLQRLEALRDAPREHVG